MQPIQIVDDGWVYTNSGKKIFCYIGLVWHLNKNVYTNVPNEEWSKEDP